MSAQKPPPDDEKLTSLLLGQLPPEEADRLANEMLDNSQVTPAAEKLADDTLMAGVKQATTAVDAESDKLAGRLVERLKSESEETTAAYPETGEAAESMPTDLEYFRVEKEIGRGGMGMVYLARDTRLNRPVAIKTLRADLARKASAKERFLREARVAAALEHESIVPIYYVGEAGGIPFLAMPVLKGQGLDAHLKANGGRLPPAEVIRIAAQIAGGLAAAHDVGLIHRDIKPSNVWVDADGRRVRVLDFGLARYETDDSHLTVSGMIVGTPAYMAPEQARGRGVDARADLFSLGVVLYQMLTGRRPFTGTDAVSIISSLALDTPAAPNVVNFDVPSELSDLVMQLLEKEPQNRPASATVVREALDRLTTQPSEDRTELDFSPPTPPRRPPNTQPKAARKFPLVPLAVAAGLFLLLAGGAAAVYQFVFGTKDGTLVVEVDDAADVRFKNGKLEVYDEAGKKLYTLEPSEKNKGLPPGKYTVKVVGADGVKLDTERFEIERNGKAFVKVTATGPKDVAAVDPKKPDPVKPTPPDVVNPAAPGTPLALKAASWKPGPADNILPGLVTRPAILDGVARWQIVPTVAVGSLAFSPDGKWVATTDADHLRVYDTTTGALTGLARHGTPPNHWTEPRWSADSKWVLCGVPAPPGSRFVVVFALDGTPSPVPPVAHAGVDFGWNPKYAVFACAVHGQDRVQIFDPTQVNPIEVDAKIGAKGRGAWSPDGETLLVVREDKTAQLFGRDGKPGAKLAGEVDPIAPPAWSADGKTIAALTGANEIGFWKADGTAGAKTGKHEKAVLGLHWKPDGKLLAVSDAEGKRHFWTPDGKGEGTADTKDGTPGFVWAKDGKGYFTPGKFWPAVGNPSFTNLTNGLNMFAVVSPDQMNVALAKRGEIVINEWKDGTARDIGWKVLQTRDGIPWWSADGKRLAVVEQNGVSLYDARDPAKVVRLGGGVGVNGVNRAAFSPKGDRFAVANDIGHLLICEPTGKPLRTLSGPAKSGATLADAVHDLQWHPDGKRLAVTTGAVTVTVYDTDTGMAEATTSVPCSRAIGSAIFSPANPDHLLIAHPDAAALWRWKVEKEPLQKFAGLGKLVPSPDGKRVLALQAGGAWHGNDFFSASLLSPDLKDRDTAGTKEYIQQIQHPGPSLVWHPDGKHLVVTRLGEARSIQIRSLDGKVAEEVKPDGIDLTWVEWVGPAVGNVLVGRVAQWSDTYLFDLTTKKVTPFGKVSGELAVAPDGKHLIALEGSTLTYWNVETKAVEQRVVLLPNGEFVTLSPAGEVLEKSANADNFYRYIVEEKSGKLAVKTPAEMAPSLPKSTGFAPLDPDWVKAVAAMPADEQLKAVVGELKKRNPQYEGKHTHRVDGGVVIDLTLNGFIEDISPLRVLTGLKQLTVHRTKELSAQNEPIPLSDLSPLRGLKLTHLKLSASKVTDLSPLRGMLLEQFTAEFGPLTDLSPLSGMPLGWVSLIGTRVTDLTPLKGATLSLLDIRDTAVTDLSSLRGQPLQQLQGTGKMKDLSQLKEFPKLGMLAWVGPDVSDITGLRGLPITALDLRGTKVTDISGVRGLPLESLAISDTKVTDLSPLKGCPLKHLQCEYNPERDREVLKSITTLETVNYKPAKEVLK